MDLAVIMNGVLIALLVVALLFGMRLNARLKVLRAGQEDFARAVAELDQAAIRAHHSLKELRSDADDSQELLHGRILAARELMQKLDNQVARAERSAHEVETNLVSMMSLQSRAEQTAKRLEAAPRMEMTSLQSAGLESGRPARSQPRLEDDADYNPAWAVPPKTPAVARGVSKDAEPQPRRDPFERDVIRFRSPAARVPMTGLPTTGLTGDARRSVLPEVPEEDETEIMDKVQMSELVVANLNEMIRTLTLPTRQVLSVEDDLFGGDAPQGKR